jgi:hypothetical protein
MSLSRSILILAAALCIGLTSMGLWFWWSAPPATVEQAEALERMKLLGALRADWLHAAGDLSETDAMQAGASDSVIHLLFLGVDRRQRERGRSDAIHILRLEPERVTLFAIPRDATVAFRGDTRLDKINHAYAHGGAPYSRKVIENLLKIRVDGYLEVDLQTFGRAAEIAKTLTLNGKLIGAEDVFAHIGNLLSWLRNRSLPGGDVRRLARQQLFIAKSLDWTLTLYREHPRVLQNAVRGILKLMPSDFSEPQVMLLCQIYADSHAAQAAARSAVDTDTDRVKARNTVIRLMERFILPGTPVMIDIRTGAVVPTDSMGHIIALPTVATELPPRAASNASDSKPMTLARLFSDSFQIGSATDAAPAKSADPDTAGTDNDTGFMLSFYQIDTQAALNPMLAEWRRRGLRRNYEDKDELLK